MAFDEGLAARIRDAFHSRRDVVEMRMFGGAAFMVRGHMTCGVVGSTLMVRIDPALAGSFLREKAVRPMDFTGRPMRGFLYVDPPGIASAAALRKRIGRAVDHTESLPPKPARRARPKARRGARRA